MAREKIRTLFSKNHIKITKIENPGKWLGVDDYPKIEYSSTASYGYSHSFYDAYEHEKKTVKKVSPLGFYYMSEVNVPKKGSNFVGGSDKTIVTYPAPGEKDAYYRLEYVTRYGENKIGGEDGLRPWDIYPGDKNFPDSMLTALLKEVESFFAIAESMKITEFKTGIYRNSNSYNFNTIKNQVYTDLFGNKNGPRFQTDMEKILSHGFDPKYSFRKDKEKK